MIVMADLIKSNEMVPDVALNKLGLASSRARRFAFACFHGLQTQPDQIRKNPTYAF